MYQEPNYLYLTIQKYFHNYLYNNHILIQHYRGKWKNHMRMMLFQTNVWDGW